MINKFNISKFNITIFFVVNTALAISCNNIVTYPSTALRSVEVVNIFNFPSYITIPVSIVYEFWNESASPALPVPTTFSEYNLTLDALSSYMYSSFPAGL